MNNKDEIKDLFSEKLGKYEAKVNPDLWVNIASQIGTGTAVVSTGMSLVTKWIIGVSSAAAIATGVVFIVNNENGIQEPIVVTEKPIITPEIDNKQTETLELIDNSIVADNSVIKEKTPTITPLQKEEPPIITPENNNQNNQTDFQERNFPLQVPEIKEPQLVVNNENQDVEKENNDENQEELEVDVKPIDNIPNVVFVEPEIRLPDVFTPDNDGINDQFFIESKGLTSFNIVILDNQNKTVFQSNDPDFIWEGYDLNGNISPNGKYLYYITAIDKNGAPIKKYSFLEIKR